MAVRLQKVLAERFGDLRYEPSAKRFRAVLGGTTVVDSTRAVLVWEPRRVIPTYAVPAEDIHAEVADGEAAPAEHDGTAAELPDVTDRPIIDPSVPFAVHSAPGQPVTISAGGAVAAGFRLAEGDVAGLVALDFAGFDAWYDEDEQVLAHPRDPFHRIDVLPSSRRVRLELDGQLLAETDRARLLFETMLPVRYYVPREDVRTELVPSDTATYCAYKGRASYFSVPAVAGGTDMVWSYPAPLNDAAGVVDMVCFFTEWVDLVLDGVPQPRPVTPWSRR